MSFFDNFFKSSEQRDNEEIQQAHNQGQSDGHTGDISAPYSPLDQTLTYRQHRIEHQDSVNEAYQAGIEHSRSQDGK